MFNCLMIKEYLDCKDSVKWKLLQLISPHVKRDTLTFRHQAWYGCIITSRMITKCAMGIPITAKSNYQTDFRPDRTCGAAGTWY